jgi:hypothetical protein
MATRALMSAITDGAAIPVIVDYMVKTYGNEQAK